MTTDIKREAREFAATWLDWYHNRSAEFFRGADIFRDEDGSYGLISAGCGCATHHIVCKNISADMFGPAGADDCSVEELAEMLVESGYMADMLGIN